MIDCWASSVVLVPVARCEESKIDPVMSLVDFLVKRVSRLGKPRHSTHQCPPTGLPRVSSLAGIELPCRPLPTSAARDAFASRTVDSLLVAGVPMYVGTYA